MPTPRSSRPLPPALRLFAALSFAISALTWSLALIPAGDHARYPLLWPFVPFSGFFDFKVFYARFFNLHTARFFDPREFHFSYFPAAVPVYRAFYRFGLPTGLYLYFALDGVLMLAGTLLFGRALVRAGLRRREVALFLAICLLCAYPAMFAAERGNLELLLAIAITAGVWAFCTGRYALAAVLWGVFGAVKLYPLLLAALFLARRGWLRFFALTLLTAAAATLLSLHYIGPTIATAWAGLHNGTAEFLHDYTLSLTSTEWDHSAFAAVKRLAISLGRPLAPLLTPYFLLAGGAMLLVYLLRIRRLPLANQILALSISLVLLPPTSFEYTLTQLYGAWGVLVWLATTTKPAQRPPPGLTLALGLMAVLFSPARLLLINGVDYAGQLKCAVLLALLVVALRRPWPPLDPIEAASPFLPATVMHDAPPVKSEPA